MLKKRKKKKKVSKPETIVQKYGYEYILVESGDRNTFYIPPPRMFGMEGMALKAVRKIKKTKNKTV